MKTISIGSLVGLFWLLPLSLSSAAPDNVPRAEDFSILAWPEKQGPAGFMTGLQLVSLLPERCRDIVADVKPTEDPQIKPHFKTPLAAAQYFGCHLNMGDPPKYMAVYTDTNGTNYYLFSGGRHWGKQPLFSEVAVLLETGEIRFYHQKVNTMPNRVPVMLSEAHGIPPSDRQEATRT